MFRCSLLSALRKCSRRWALLTSAEVWTDQERSAEDVDSLHTVTVDVQGGRGALFRRKSRTSSLVLVMFSAR